MIISTLINKKKDWIFGFVFIFLWVISTISYSDMALKNHFYYQQNLIEENLIVARNILKNEELELMEFDSEDVYLVKNFFNRGDKTVSSPSIAPTSSSSNNRKPTPFPMNNNKRIQFQESSPSKTKFGPEFYQRPENYSKRKSVVINSSGSGSGGGSGRWI